jgi:hypothetical protein
MYIYIHKYILICIGDNNENNSIKTAEQTSAELFQQQQLKKTNNNVLNKNIDDKSIDKKGMYKYEYKCIYACAHICMCT